MSIRRHLNHRLANWRKSPTPDYPKPDYQPPTQRFSAASPRTNLASGKLPTRRMSLPLCRQEDYYYWIRAGFPYIYWRFYLLTPDCRLLGDLSSRSHNLTFLWIYTRNSSETNWLSHVCHRSHTPTEARAYNDSWSPRQPHALLWTTATDPPTCNITAHKYNHIQRPIVTYVWTC